MDPFESSSSSIYNQSTIAIIDGCRKTSIHCDRNALTFLCDHSGLEDYKSIDKLCEDCYEAGKQSTPVGINAHGYFCSSIIASRRFVDASLGRIKLGTISGISPPPRIAIYAIGCPCGYIDNDSVNHAIYEAISAKVDVISMSLSKSFSSLFSDESSDAWGVAIMEALREDILIVLSAGNYGKLGLQSIQKTPPWTVTVASCTPTTKFKSKVEFVSDTDFYELEDIEGYSISMFSSSSSNDDFLPVRKLGDIQDTQSIMYLKNSEILVEPSSDFSDSASIQPIVLLSKEASNIVCYYLESVTAKNGSLYAIIHCSSRKEVGSTPLVSDFSGRGPCRTYTEFMKPDLCAPGEHIVASWPDDVPLGDDGDSFFVPYNVLSGTSFATPLVAAGLAMIKAEKNFSVSATISAAITTANKMHGKDLAFEFAYGAGEFNLKRARQPGLVYEEKHCIFERFYLSDGEDPPYFHLNLPYFSATFPPHCEEKWAIKFSRKLRSVEKGRSTYTAKIEIHSSTMRMPAESISISVVPKILEFDDMDCEQQFTLNVSLPNTKYYEWSFGVISGSLIWTKNADKEDQRTVVDSPILLSSRHVPSRPVGVYPSSC